MERLVGRRVVKVEADPSYLRIRFDDGSELEVTPYAERGDWEEPEDAEAFLEINVRGRAISGSRPAPPRRP